MSNWRPIVLDDLTAASVSGKVTLVRAAASARSLPDPAPAAVANVTLELRGAIGFSGRYAVDQDTTALPGSLLDLAINRIVRAMSKSVGLPLTEDERADDRTYESRLDKIRKGEWPVENADTAAAAPEVQTSTPTPLISAPARRFTACDQDGI